MTLVSMAVSCRLVEGLDQHIDYLVNHKKADPTIFDKDGFNAVSFLVKSCLIGTQLSCLYLLTCHPYVSGGMQLRLACLHYILMPAVRVTTCVVRHDLCSATRRSYTVCRVLM